MRLVPPAFPTSGAGGGVPATPVRPGEQAAEHVVGLGVGQMLLEQVQVAVQGSGQAEALHQQAAGPEAAAVQTVRLVPDLVVDIVVTEQAAVLLGPWLAAQVALNTALAIAESLAYVGVHLKYLRAGGKGDRRHKPIPPELPRHFNTFLQTFQTRGDGGHASSGSRIHPIFPRRRHRGN